MAGKKLIFPYLATDVQVIENKSEAAETDSLLTERLIHKAGANGIRTTLSLYVEKAANGKFYTLPFRGTSLVEFSGECEIIKFHKLHFTTIEKNCLRERIQIWNQKNILKELIEVVDGVIGEQHTAGKRIWQAISSI